ncbi:NADP-dependent oxidoreductase [Dyadobacter sp. CY312]|uniref:NADP-dependent oxidoreductase n=1 Tax=Dyadobacter sp. CY312 TaxID=2907303 RepID=UPI001F1776FF|nr:NADP-dependent oxidoreductase [Dyadobacter sp. CY312]MCE7042432.1 NADP-dependent oxidoreductase [Dyadobacter sp. CY312]
MKAIILNEFGGVENLIAAEVDKPVIASDEVLVKPSSISINPVDVKTRSGKGIAGLIKDQMPVILGWDIAGVITEIGVDVTDFKVGDEVFAMLAFPKPGKVYAEHVAAKATELALKPANISMDEAAAAPLAALTAWQALTHHAKIKAGDRVLIHAAAGGVGHYAVQIAKYLGAYVIGTSSDANRDFVLSLDADEHIDYKAGPFEEVVEDIDFVLDSIGGEYIDRSLKVIKKGGTIISIPSGLNETVTEKAKELGIEGYTIKVFPSGAGMRALADLLERGIIRSHVSETFSFDQMAEAHRQIETGRTVGKITLQF